MTARPPSGGLGLTPDAFRARVIADPEWYIREVLGQNPWEKQIEIVESVLRNRRTAVSGCVASSKTYAAAMAVLAFMHAFGPKCEAYLTAPTFRQVKKVQFKNLKLLHRYSRLPLGGRMIDTEWKLADDWFAVGFSPKDPDSVHGVHAKNILIWIDEAQGVEQEIVEAAENALAGGNAHMLLTFNPNAGPGEEAYECTHGKRGLYTGQIRIDADSTPNVRAGKTIIPGMIEKHQRDEWVKTYGWDSNFVRVKVRALPPKQVADAVIPIEWIEKAIHRQVRTGGERVLGVDVARFGDDDSTIAPMHGRRVMPLEVYHGLDNPQVAGRVRKRGEADGSSRVFIDVIGVGSGVVDILRHDKYRPARGVNVATKPRNAAKFADLRSEIVWALREALDPSDNEPIALPNDNDLMAELSDIRYDLDRKGRIRVESKDEIRARLGRSPDRLDAVVLAHYAASRSLKAASAGAGAGVEERAQARPDDRGVLRGRAPYSGGGIRRLTDRFGLRGRRP